MKGDYYRYLAEVAAGEERQSMLSKFITENEYKLSQISFYFNRSY